MLEDLKIWGYNGYLVDKYQPIVAGLRNLRTLNISPYSICDSLTDSFCSDEQLFHMLQGMAEIEQVHLPVIVGSGFWDAVKDLCKDRGIRLEVS